MTQAESDRSPKMRMSFVFVVLATTLGFLAEAIRTSAWADEAPTFVAPRFYEYPSMQSEESLINRAGNRKFWAGFYAAHAEIRLGKEQRLANGVSWRLLVDQRTGIAMPRITWMPDRKSMETANAMLVALHGRALQAARFEARSTLEMMRPSWWTIYA